MQRCSVVRTDTDLVHSLYIVSSLCSGEDIDWVYTDTDPALFILSLGWDNTWLLQEAGRTLILSSYAYTLEEGEWMSCYGQQVNSLFAELLLLKRTYTT